MWVFSVLIDKVRPDAISSVDRSDGNSSGTASSPAEAPGWLVAFIGPGSDPGLGGPAAARRGTHTACRDQDRQHPQGRSKPTLVAHGRNTLVRCCVPGRELHFLFHHVGV